MKPADIILPVLLSGSPLYTSVLSPVTDEANRTPIAIVERCHTCAPASAPGTPGGLSYPPIEPHTLTTNRLPLTYPVSPLDIAMDEIYAQCAQGLPDRALDRIYDEVDERLDADDLDGIARLLERADVARLDVPSMLGFLSTTISVRLSVPARGDYLRRVRAALREQRTEEEVRELLRGLE